MSRNPVVVALALATLAVPGTAFAATPGDLDTSFVSGNGFRTVDIKVDGNGCNNTATQVLVQGDGKIVLAGVATGCTPNRDERMVAVRLSAAGALDSGYGNGGKDVIDGLTGRTDEGYFDGRAAFAPNGDVFLLAGTADLDTGAGIGWVAARLAESNGGLDAGWDGDGRKDLTTGEGIGDIGVQSSGKVVIFDDFFDTAPAPDNYQMRVCRYLDTGALDASFGSGGCRAIAFDIGGTNNDRARVLKVLSDDRILAAGHADSASNANDFAVAMLTVDGDLDASFGGDGKVTMNFALGIGSIEEVRALDEDAKGRIYAGGLAGQGESGNTNDCALARFMPNGDPDPDFGGGDGKVNFDYSGGSTSFEQIFGLAVQGDGRVVVAGRGATGSNTSRRAAVARLDESGALDPTFSGDGVQIYSVFSSAATPVTVGRAMALQQDGRIVISGYAKDVDNNFFAARLHNDYVFGDGFERGNPASWSSQVP